MKKLIMLLCLPLLCATAIANDTDELAAFFKKNDFKRAVIKPANGILKHEYVVPDGPYTHLFDWDMYFMGVAFSYDKMGTPIVNSVKSFLEFVNETANWPGYAPREIAPDALWALPEMCKPFLAQAAQLASRVTGDASWLLEKDTGSKTASNYEKLAAMLSFWENNRKSADGLFRWYNGVESGVDNNPAVSDNPSLVTEGVDLQCYLYREYLAMAALAGKLGKADDAAAYTKKAQDLKALTLAKMWSEKDGMFYNIDSRTGEMVKINTWTGFTPLWVGIASPEQAKRLVEEHLLNSKEFWSPNGVRTIAITEPLYNPKSGYWRGPVWIISNYLVMHGLLNYGYKKEALELAEKTVSRLTADLRATGGMNENYNPETGEPTAGGHFLSWNLLAEHMVEEAKKGYDPAALVW
ncbi:MAG: trehalase family glycosidase [Elusimicrobiales bacterium]